MGPCVWSEQDKKSSKWFRGQLPKERGAPLVLRGYVSAPFPSAVRVLAVMEGAWASWGSDTVGRGARLYHPLAVRPGLDESLRM